jgi:hypothetical protein
MDGWLVMRSDHQISIDPIVVLASSGTYSVSLLEKKLRQVGSILTRDSSY